MYLGSIVEDAGFGFGDVVFLVCGVEDEFAKIVSESSFVGLESFLWSVFASVVDIDANWSSELNA